MDRGPLNLTQPYCTLSPSEPPQHLGFSPELQWLASPAPASPPPGMQAQGLQESCEGEVKKELLPPPVRPSFNTKQASGTC